MFLTQEMVQDVAYQWVDATCYSDKQKDLKLKKINKKILMNNILCAILGGLIGAGIVSAPNIYKAVSEKIVSVSSQNTK